jgi:CRISPR-associated endonuclease/helicase Cas3
MDHVHDAAGPRLVILNTVQNAAIVADAMRRAGFDVLHLSTALTPRDRDRVLNRVIRRLDAKQRNWTLVATSCVEAGLDLSFRSAFRERFTASSTIQVGGRINRHGEYDAGGGGVVYDLALADMGITQHPAATVSADVLRQLLAADELNRRAPADVVTRAMREELAARGGLGSDPLAKAEGERNYPAVKKHGRVIEADTRIVVVDDRLKKQIAERAAVAFGALLRGSVEIRATKIDKLGLGLLPGRRDLFAWDGPYEPDFLGYMAGVLRNKQFLREGGAVV